MSGKKGTALCSDPFQPKITRNDRFAQMSHQEKVIEQKKREIQAKLDARRESFPVETKAVDSTPTPPLQPKIITTPKVANVPAPKETSNSCLATKKLNAFNFFSNDGSFLNTFKQLKDKKADQPMKPKQVFRPKKDLAFISEQRAHKNSRWSQQGGPRSTSPKNLTISPLISSNNMINNKTTNLNPTTTSNPNRPRISRFSNADNPPQPPPPQHHHHPQQQIPPQNMIPNNNNNINHPIQQAPPVNCYPINEIIIPQNVTGLPLLLNTTNAPPPPPLLLAPPPMLPTEPTVQNMSSPPPQLELSSIPPPNPIQVHNIPQPEPINALTIPHPAPIQVRNIPTPAALHLNEIPSPKPLDLLAIPAPDCDAKMATSPPVMLNVPPPNRAVPPPSVVSGMFVPPPVPPPGAGGGGAGVQIPSLMSRPIFPPPGMVVEGISSGVNVINCPPPPILTAPPPAINRPPPPFVNPLPRMNVPPPVTLSVANNNPGMHGAPFKADMTAVFPPGGTDYEAMTSLGRMVAQCGPGIEEVVRQKQLKTQDPSLWFLFHKESAAYKQYRQTVERFKREMDAAAAGSSAGARVKEEATCSNDEEVYKPEDIYEPEMASGEEEMGTFREKDFGLKAETDCGKRKRKSRWGDKDTSSAIPPPKIAMAIAPPNYVQPPPEVNLINPVVPHNPHMKNSGVLLSRITRTDPGLIQYAINTYGSAANLTEEEWNKAEDHYKINLLYQDMMKKREQLEKLQRAGRNKYDYDSDEDVDGGTWEHKLRDKEMTATERWAEELNRQAEGKHHIGDFLPPEELKRFMEKSNAVKEGQAPSFSDYKEFKIKEDNIGFKMLQKLGWSQGQGLGSNGEGIMEPINKGASRDHKEGLGLGNDEEEGNRDDEYDAYRKRMMLAYRFRPNPLNNPRRPYY